jgi:hypothetical protein
MEKKRLEQAEQFRGLLDGLLGQSTKKQKFDEGMP